MLALNPQNSSLQFQNQSNQLLPSSSSSISALPSSSSISILTTPSISVSTTSSSALPTSTSVSALPTSSSTSINLLNTHVSLTLSNSIVTKTKSRFIKIPLPTVKPSISFFSTKKTTTNLLNIPTSTSLLNNPTSNTLLNIPTSNTLQNSPISSTSLSNSQSLTTTLSNSQSLTNLPTLSSTHLTPSFSNLIINSTPQSPLSTPSIIPEVNLKNNYSPTTITSNQILISSTILILLFILSLLCCCIFFYKKKKNISKHNNNLQTQNKFVLKNFDEKINFNSSSLSKKKEETNKSFFSGFFSTFNNKKDNLENNKNFIHINTIPTFITKDNFTKFDTIKKNNTTIIQNYQSPTSSNLLPSPLDRNISLNDSFENSISEYFLTKTDIKSNKDTESTIYSIPEEISIPTLSHQNQIEEEKNIIQENDDNFFKLNNIEKINSIKSFISEWYLNSEALKVDVKQDLVKNTFESQDSLGNLSETSDIQFDIQIAEHRRTKYNSVYSDISISKI
ncbi:hypothetical protein HDU92_005089 [Lobulomyces angularis]|nr:hypothetical protein HDU92_005089 [Lobulomyces angularis]